MVLLFLFHQSTSSNRQKCLEARYKLKTITFLAICSCNVSYDPSYVPLFK